MGCVVGIMAHDEGANIASALESALSQEGSHLGRVRFVVVASGCKDDTVGQARGAAGDDRRVRILEQARREGKASAITLLLRQSAEADRIVLMGGDTILEAGTLEALLAPFDDPRVGMTGGRPVPVNAPDSWMGRVVHLLWNLHHEIARTTPKLGELVAFRRLFESIPSDTAVDEASIEGLVLERGLRLVYVPEARVRMKGPETVVDYLSQRRRIHAGHLHLRRVSGHEVSTMSAPRVLRVAWSGRPPGFRGMLTLALAAGLEAAARILGAWDEKVLHRDHRAWKRIPSTKDLSS